MLSRAVRVLVLLLVPLVAAPAAPAGAAGELTVAAARAGQDGSVATVRGYVVGQPTASSTVVTSGYPSDYALALADAAGETDTSRMVYVQVPGALRSAWGLRSHPELLGERLDVTGTLASYFARPGLTGATSLGRVGSEPEPEPQPEPEPEPDPGPDPVEPGEYDETYYADAIGRTGPALEASLHAIVSTGVTRLSYDEVWDALRHTDEDPADAGNVIELYTGDSVSEDDNGGGPEQWNREHVWAKSHGDFGTATGPGTDLHHLRPTDVTVNGARGNLDFDEGGTESAEAPGNYADDDSWEPRDAVKGDVARMVLYMSVRYEGDDGFADLEVNDIVGNGSAPRLGRLSTLLAWNAADPVDDFEMRRNDVIYERYQRNRNPFVDHPEWADAIWADAA